MRADDSSNKAISAPQLNIIAVRAIFQGLRFLRCDGNPIITQRLLDDVCLWCRVFLDRQQDRIIRRNFIRRPVSILDGKIKNAMIIGKGSLFLGRMTNLFDGVSFVIHGNTAAVQEEAAGVSEEEVKGLIAKAMKEFAATLMAE